MQQTEGIGAFCRQVCLGGVSAITIRHLQAPSRSTNLHYAVDARSSAIMVNSETRASRHTTGTTLLLSKPASLCRKRRSA